MTISAGTRLGPYEILGQIGAGGMGEVWRAKDPRLGRDVAIKVLPASYSQDADRLRRFEQEARAAGVLNHPNITAVYDIGQHDGSPYVVQELLEGETLRTALSGGKLSERRAIDYGLQIAHGLAAAHEKGIVHRDLKPENLFVTNDGRVKILDFGLAKLMHSEEAGVQTNLPTATAGTEPGVVLGTLGYMSPEQVRGKPADARSDIFSFGAILFEMLSGRRAFQGDSAADTMSAILREDPPDLSLANQSLALGLGRIVRHCLEKNPERRFHSAHDVAFDLESLSDASVPTLAVRAHEQKPIRKLRFIWAVAGVAALLAAMAAVLVSLRPHQVGIDSLAVLPFRSMSADADTDYLSDGITDSLTNKLSQLPALRVVARTIVSPYKGHDSDTKKIGRELDVKAVLSGKVTRRGDSLLVQAELVDVRAGSQLWGESYTRKVVDIQSMEQDIAKEISDRLRPKLTGEDKKRLSKSDTTNADAYQLYLKGRYAWEKRTTESLKQSIEYFNQAIEKDASYAVAYAGLSNSYAVLSAWDFMSPKESFPKAISAAKRALEIDDGLAQPHATLGWALTAYDWNFPAAEKEFRTAVQLDPGYATAHHWYGLMLSALARSDESIAELGLATKLDPFSVVMQTNTVRVFIHARQSDRAVESARSVVERQPTSDLAHLWLGYAYESKGMLADALAEYSKSKNTAGIGRVFARMGRRSEARAIASDLEQKASRAYVSPFDIARVFAALGDKDRAFEWLDRAYADHSTNLLYAKVNPNLDELHSDPRFTELLRRMNLPA